jgi:hypothetical protein
MDHAEFPEKRGIHSVVYSNSYFLYLVNDPFKSLENGSIAFAE